MASFVSGLDLSRAFYEEVVSRILATTPHGAALMGEGSEVLGFDTTRSSDHAWGPRLQIFVDSNDVEAARDAIERDLPAEFAGRPVRYFRWQTGAVGHHVEVNTLHGWLLDWLKFDPRDGMPTERWLATPQQLLLEVTAGAVYRDDLGELADVRESLRWYPEDVWVWLMGCEWARIAEHEAIVGRTHEVGDDIGSRLAVAIVVRHVMRLCFLQERRYPPYAKWLGTAFAQLAASKDLGPHLDVALSTGGHAQRETALGHAYVSIAQRHNSLGVTPAVDEGLGDYDVGIDGATRPYVVLNAARFVRACRDALHGSEIVHLANVGSIDQLAVPTDEIIHFSDWSSRLAAMYRDKLNSATPRTGAPNT